MTSSSQHGPLHVLMAMPPTEQQHYLSNPRIEQDYVSRRAKAHGITNTTTSGGSSVWHGVSKTEHALIQCCELNEAMLQEEMEVVMFRSPNNTPLMGGGALDMEHEVRFAGILARNCHDLATRALALAILERTLEAHLMEEAEAQVRLGKEPIPSQDGEPQADETKSEEPPVKNEEKEEEPQPGQKRRSHRLRGQETKYKRTKRKEDDTKNSVTKEQGKTLGQGKWMRLEQFFAAGGLRILNRWLVEASEDEIVLDTSKAALGSNRTKLQPSPTRPLILPLLRFLERIPFDKKLVLDSKINKQIRNIEKQVDKIRGEANPEDLKGWTTSKSDSKTNPLDLVREAVEQVKKAWGENAKKEKQTFGDPFVSIKEMIRERMEAMIDFGRGAAPRPEWLEEEPKKVAVPKKSRSELAAKERQAEAEIRKHLDQDLQNKLREAEKRHREHLAMLREKRKMMLATEPIDVKKKSGGRRVQWKDGMKTKSSRNRKVLEEVYIFDKRTPANKELAHLIGEDDREITPDMNERTDGLLEQEDMKVTSTDSGDVIDLTL